MTLDDKIHHANEIANAIQRRENMYSISLKEGNGLINYDIELPTPQVAGTMTQQRTYATGKAMEIIEQITRS